MQGLRFALLLLASLASSAALADAETELGRRVAHALCGSCHLIDKLAPGETRASPNPSAPPFQIIAYTYRPGDLEEALAEGIVVGHRDRSDPEMPELELTGGEASALIAYLQFLRGP